MFETVCSTLFDLIFMMGVCKFALDCLPAAPSAAAAASAVFAAATASLMAALEIGASESLLDVSVQQQQLLPPLQVLLPGKFQAGPVSFKCN
jgi:hypothetical protein